MSSITELAKLFKERENKSDYSPIIGTIISLPNLKIRIGDKIIITDENLIKCIDVSNKSDDDGHYIYLNKKVVLLPYAENQKFILVGLVK